jgi:NAD(P)-dependent dehydrogenase (short-subunit alcohol dehydrogenase family)
LRDKRILLTGGSRGLGRALCGHFATQGARVAFTYARDQEGARSLQANCPNCLAFQVSVLDLAATETLVANLEATWGGIDILVNNAGISQAFPMALIEEEDYDHVMEVNAKGTFLTCKAVLPGMIRRKAGLILNIGSLAGVRMIQAPPHYCASKAAIKALTQSLAKEFGRHGIRVLCLAPGLLEEGIGKNVPEIGLADYLRHCALGRVGTLEEVARFAAFLISDRNTYMNGETIVMDGGL